MLTMPGQSYHAHRPAKIQAGRDALYASIDAGEARGRAITEAALVYPRRLFALVVGDPRARFIDGRPPAHNHFALGLEACDPREQARAGWEKRVASHGGVLNLGLQATKSVAVTAATLCAPASRAEQIRKASSVAVEIILSGAHIALELVRTLSPLMFRVIVDLGAGIGVLVGAGFGLIWAPIALYRDGQKRGSNRNASVLA